MNRFLRRVLILIVVLLGTNLEADSYQCGWLFQNETRRIEVRPRVLSGTPVVLDTNLAQSFIFEGVLNQAFFRNSSPELKAQINAHLEKINSGHIDEEKLYRDSRYGKRLIEEGHLSELQYKLARILSRAGHSRYNSFLSILNEHFESQKDFGVVVTPQILREVFSSEFDLDGNVLNWRGPETIIKTAIPRDAWLENAVGKNLSVARVSKTDRDSEFQDFLSQLQKADLGGSKGESDRKIAAELRSLRSPEI